MISERTGLYNDNREFILTFQLVLWVNWENLHSGQYQPWTNQVMLKVLGGEVGRSSPPTYLGS